MKQVSFLFFALYTASASPVREYVQSTLHLLSSQQFYVICIK